MYLQWNPARLVWFSKVTVAKWFTAFCVESMSSGCVKPKNNDESYFFCNLTWLDLLSDHWIWKCVSGWIPVQIRQFFLLGKRNQWTWHRLESQVRIIQSRRYTGCNKKNGPPLWLIHPPLDPFSMIVLKFLTEKVKSKLFCMRLKHIATIKHSKNAGKML